MGGGWTIRESTVSDVVAETSRTWIHKDTIQMLVGDVEAENSPTSVHQDKIQIFKLCSICMLPWKQRYLEPRTSRRIVEKRLLMLRIIYVMINLARMKEQERITSAQ